MPGAWERPEAELAKMLGGDLPAECPPPRDYDGPPRVVVPAVRTSLESGEASALKVLVLSKDKPAGVVLYWRGDGPGRLRKVPLESQARGVFAGTLAPPSGDIEYYIEVRADGGTARFPVTAPRAEPDRDRPAGGEMSEIDRPPPKRLRAAEVVSALEASVAKSADGALDRRFQGGRGVRQLDPGLPGPSLRRPARRLRSQLADALTRAEAGSPGARRRRPARKTGANRRPPADRFFQSLGRPFPRPPASWDSSWLCSATSSITSALFQEAPGRLSRGDLEPAVLHGLPVLPDRLPAPFPRRRDHLHHLGRPDEVFGAEMYIADLVGYAMLRELVPLMTGVILAGKVGAAVTAELASMSVLEEVDALQTMGLVPEKFLMVPRLLAITLAVPLLVALADVVGVFGRHRRRPGQLRDDPSAFLNQMVTSVDWTASPGASSRPSFSAGPSCRRGLQGPDGRPERRGGRPGDDGIRRPLGHLDHHHRLHLRLRAVLTHGHRHCERA